MEEWRKLKKLGCLLIDKEGIRNRKSLANIASNKLECIWLSRRIAFIQRRDKLYNIFAILHCSTAAAPRKGDNPG